jgi:hypothetical protein
MHLCEGQFAGERKVGRNWERDGSGLQALGIPYRRKRSKRFVSWPVVCKQVACFL